MNSQKYHSSGCIGHGKLIQLFERLKFGAMQQVLAECEYTYGTGR